MTNLAHAECINIPKEVYFANVYIPYWAFVYVAHIHI
jgi:hypothetical protein